MVQEAACTTFSSMITTKKEKLEPYLMEIFQVKIWITKVITSIIDKYKGNSLLNLFDIISFMSEEYSDHFKNKDFAEPLIKCMVNKWAATGNQDYQNLIPIIEVLCSIIKVSGNLISPYCEEFYKRALKIIEELFLVFKVNLSIK